MANISRATIKELVKVRFGVSITDDGADEIAEILEKEAQRISSFAVENAKKQNRGKVTKSDISEYTIRNDVDGS